MANNLKYRKAWAWPKQVEDFIALQCEGLVVHVCSGSSQLGDIRVDQYEPADINADVLEGIPIESNYADTVVCDPPWSLDNKFRMKLLRELRRILKFGGQLIFNAPWSPKCPGMMLEVVYVPEWQLMSFSNVSLIWVARKIKSDMFEISSTLSNQNLAP